MLTTEQIDYALTCYEHVDVAPDLLGGVVAQFHHTERGVFCIVRDAQSNSIIMKDCFHVPYLWLAIMNSRDWPVSFVHGQYTVIEDCGQYLAVRLPYGRTQYVDKKGDERTGGAPVKIDDPGVLGWFFTAKKNSIRDEHGLPKIHTEWNFDGRPWSVVGIRKKSNTVELSRVGDDSKRRLLSLKAFNEKATPRRLA